MRGGHAIRLKHATLNGMLLAAAQSGASLVFVNRKEEDQEVPMARVRDDALSGPHRGLGVVAHRAGEGSCRDPAPQPIPQCSGVENIIRLAVGVGLVDDRLWVLLAPSDPVSR